MEPTLPRRLSFTAAFAATSFVVLSLTFWFLRRGNDAPGDVDFKQSIVGPLLVVVFQASTVVEATLLIERFQRFSRSFVLGSGVVAATLCQGLAALAWFVGDRAFSAWRGLAAMTAFIVVASMILVACPLLAVWIVQKVAWRMTRGK